MVKLVSNKIKTAHGLFHYLRRSDWLARIVSVLIAFSLWHMVGREDVIDKTIVVQVELLNLPRNLVIANQFKRDIEVTISGPKASIEKMTRGSLTRQVNLAAAQPGTFVINNDNDSIPAPRGITILRVQPASILLSIDKLAQKYFPVVPVTKGEVATGFQLDGLTMEPSGITISGPDTVLSQFEELRTKIIDLSGLKESKQSQIPLDLTSDIVDLIGNTSVTASIRVSVKTVEKIVPGVEVNLLIGGVRQKVNPARVDVLLLAPQMSVKKGVDLHDMIALTAIMNPDGETARLTATAKDQNGLKIEVISVFPATVHLVDPPPKPTTDSHGQAAHGNDKTAKTRDEHVPAKKK
jgi:hypothetical protein